MQSSEAAVNLFTGIEPHGVKNVPVLTRRIVGEMSNA
jgi:hypothetical protein